MAAMVVLRALSSCRLLVDLLELLGVPGVGLCQVVELFLSGHGLISV
jgi:hypothetical protein